MAYLRLRNIVALMAVAIGLSQGTRGEQISISVTNNQPSGGFSLTPVWLGLHNGTFDLFDAGETAGSALEALAELGNTAPLMDEFMGMGPQTTLQASGGGPFTPGASNSAVLDVANPALSRYLSFASMLVPSNDLFVGNDNPMAYALFDEMGKFTGPLTIKIFGRMIWDAGTEVNDIGDGGAFASGVDATLGTPEGGSVQLFFSLPGSSDYLLSLNGVMTPAGAISSLFGEDDLIATLRISAVPEPSSVALVGLGVAGLAGGAWASRRRKPGMPG